MRPLLLCISSLLLISAVLLHFFGIQVPYLNLWLWILVPLFVWIGISVLAFSHPLWRLTSILLVLPVATHRLLNANDGVLWVILAVILYWKYIVRRMLSPIATGLRRMMADREIVTHVGMVVCLLLLASVAYWGMWNLYFEGDEWYQFRTYIPAMQRSHPALAGIVQSFLEPASYGFHQSYFVNWIYPITFSFFGLHAEAYLTLSLLLHVSVAYVVFLFVRVLTNESIIAAAVSVLFSVLAAQSQAVTWIAASLSTQLSTLFGFISITLLLLYAKNQRNRRLFVSVLCMLLSLWSKETAVFFLFLWLGIGLTSTNRRRVCLFWFVVISGIFVSFRVLPALFMQQKSSLDLFLQLSDPTARGLFIFRAFAFPLKMFSQVFLPSETIIAFSAWIADQQFPYFVSEKAIRGMTYVNFIQSAMPEMLSYLLSVSIFFLGLLSTPYRWRSLSLYSIGAFVMGTVPILLLTLMFPWWGWSSLIDSRHFYHLSAFPLLFLSLAFSGLLVGRKKVRVFGFILVVALVALFNIKALQERLEPLLATAVQRKKILTQIQHEIGKPPKRLILYTQSNKSYYGFAEFMLPFQTAVVHMLPVLFSQELNPVGIEYPKSFFSSTFFSKGGLTAQGYREEEGKGIGYFLDKKYLMRQLVALNLKPDNVFAFRYDGDTNEVESFSTAMQEELGRFFASRVVFSDWKPVLYTDLRLRFSIQPDWSIRRTESVVSILDKSNRELFVIESFAPGSLTHSQFALARGKEDAMRTYVRDYDFDTARIEYYFDSPGDNRRFLIAGNNMMFYILTPRQGAPLDLFLRNFEYWDDGNDEFLFQTL